MATKLEQRGDVGSGDRTAVGAAGECVEDLRPRRPRPVFGSQISTFLRLARSILAGKGPMNVIDVQVLVLPVAVGFLLASERLDELDRR